MTQMVVRALDVYVIDTGINTHHVDIRWPSYMGQDYPFE